MIQDPINDKPCLRLAHEQARTWAKHPVMVRFAHVFQSPEELAAFLRTQPQELDAGDPEDGPRIACQPSQRLRMLPLGVNCFEATVMYLALAEAIDPGTPRTSCTIRVGSGYHTFPVERGRPVILDPEPPRNAMRAGLYECERQNGERPSLFDAGEVRPWLFATAAQAAATPYERELVRNAAQDLNRALYTGKPLRNLPALAVTIALAERDAALWGDEGLDALNQATEGLRNFVQRLELGRVAGLARRIGERALERLILAEAGPAGLLVLQELKQSTAPAEPGKVPELPSITTARPAPARPPERASRPPVDPLHQLVLQ